MKRIAIIAVYFGSFPDHHKLFEESVRHNSSIDFLIFTDQKMESTVANLRYVKCSLKNLNAMIKEKLNLDYILKKPYKCCDFKPTYGILFEDFLKDYDFWGHCDLDMIFGDIRKFITDDVLDCYDKILSLGHLSLYRNTKDVNKRFMDEGSKCGDYKKVFSSDGFFGFDELAGIGQIYYYNKYSFYDKIIFADISILRRRFTLTAGNKNYKNQIFYYENGRVFRAYETNGFIKKDEFIYIHFKQRKYLKNFCKNCESECFYICNDGFIPKKSGLPSLCDIKRMNNYRGGYYELLESNFNSLRDRAKRKWNRRLRK